MQIRNFLVIAMGFSACIAANGVAAEGIALVRDGEPVSAIVIPDGAWPAVHFAAEELQYHVTESTGATLLIREENEVATDPEGLIYLGACQKTVSVGIKTKELPPNAFHIKLLEGNLFFAGEDSDGAVLDSRNIKGSLHDNKTHVGTLFAVYEFLDKHLGVRWLWPGKMGEVIPKRKDLNVSDWDQTYIPKLLHTRIRDYYTQRGPGWSSPEVADDYFRDQAIWLRRHRFAQGMDMDYGHAFHYYWERFGQIHPEYFALSPDGKREPIGPPHLVQMCVSQPALWKQIIDAWKAGKSDEAPPHAWINGAENDSAGDPSCTCEPCRAWDVTGTDSLSDRYARFWLELQRLGEKVKPDATVIGYAYGSYRDPPVATRLNERIVVGIVPGFYFPWTDEVRGHFREQWKGWTEIAGARAYLRPNYFHFGHNMPVFIARKFGEDFSFAYKRGMLATDFDLVPGQWATQGPAYYVLGRIHRHGDWPVERMLGEYYRGFGKAESAVRAYFRHWEGVTDAVTQEHYNEGWKPKGITDNPEHRFYRWASHIFTPEVMASGRALLEEAKAAAQGDAHAERGVAFLEMGLRHAELTLTVEAAYDAYKAGGNVEAYVTALKVLDDYRASVDRYNVANMARLRSREPLWDRNLQ